MAIKSNGPLSFSEIASEFGDTAPHSMSEFIRGGGKVPQAGANGNIPASAAVMRFSHFYGAVNVIAYTASNGTNLNASTAFGSSWSDNVPKELVIPSGVTIGSTSTGTAALILPTGMGGSLTIKNSGSIQGAGGAVGATGGDAILVQVSGITIENSGSIYAGGGGGGLGGTGGQGSFSSVQQLGPSPLRESRANRCSLNCSKYVFGAGAYCCGHCYDSDDNDWVCNGCCKVVTTITNSGVGGAGGRGQGYSQSAASGSVGSTGGTNAGTGGTGGTGGAFGASGATGATGANGNYTNGSAGSAGGLAGYYVNGIGNVTFSVTGTVGGRTA